MGGPDDASLRPTEPPFPAWKQFWPILVCNAVTDDYDGFDTGVR